MSAAPGRTSSNHRRPMRPRKLLPCPPDCHKQSDSSRQRKKEIELPNPEEESVKENRRLERRAFIRLFSPFCSQTEVPPCSFLAPDAPRKILQRYVRVCVVLPCSGRMIRRVAARFSPAASSPKCNGAHPAHREDAKRRGEDPKKVIIALLR